ncbi:hypothetical protein [Shinella zoogloeoides]|uniref:hypothetical protein n=1 Tax=Shinella zoogloeoides TaxID=352475 RepID=UPI0028AA3878|nr:hypothetical protein [Shinella zoogloeoides]
MEDWLANLRRRYQINEDAEFTIRPGWHDIVERLYDEAAATLGDPAKMFTLWVKQKLARLDIHVRVPNEHRTMINWYLWHAAEEASHTCEHCGSPKGSETPRRHIVECDDCRDFDLALDQRRRRAEEIGSAARKYVRDCAHAGKVLDIREWAERRWRKDGPPKRKAMTDALRDEIRLGVAVVDIWRRFEIGGRIACELIGAKTYADLYRILRDKELAPGFQPREVVQWVADGKMDSDRVGEIFGIADDEVDAFLSAWLASEDTPKDDEEP